MKIFTLRLFIIIIFFHINIGQAQIPEFKEFVKKHISKDVYFAYARGNSVDAYGWGYGITLKVASQRALKECNSRDRHINCALKSVQNIVEEYSYLKNKSSYITKKDKSKSQVSAKGLREYEKFILDNKKRFKWFAYAENTSGKQWGFGASTYSQNSADKRAIKNCNNGYGCRVVKMQGINEQINLPLLNDIMDIFIATSNANIRSEPTTNSSIVKTVSKEKTVFVSGKVRGTEWYQIIQGSKIIGYSHKSLFITMNEYVLILKDRDKKDKEKELNVKKKEELLERKKERELNEKKKERDTLKKQEELIVSLNSKIQDKEIEIKLLEKKLSKVSKDLEDQYQNMVKTNEFYKKEIKDTSFELNSLKKQLSEKSNYLEGLRMCLVMNFMCLNL